MRELITGLNPDLRSFISLSEKVGQLSCQVDDDVKETVEKLKSSCLQYYVDGARRMVNSLLKGLSENK